jgi:hypothetical protein
MNVHLLRFVLVVAALSTTRATFGAEYQQAENLAPESAETAPLSLDGFHEALKQGPVRRIFRERLADAQPFWRDASLDFGLRIYDFRRDNGIETIADSLAVGTELTFNSGIWRERLSTVITWHTSFGMGTPEGSGSSGLLGEGESDLSVISNAYLQYEFGDVLSTRLYRQEFNMPYMNRQDIRMIPNTFEGYVLRYPGKRLEWLAGHVTKIKKRDSEEFVPMAEAAGVDGDDTGTSVVVGRYNFADNSVLGVVFQHTDDLFSTAFSDGTVRRTLSENWGLQLAAQLTKQWSVGGEKLGDFSTHTWGLRGMLSYRGAVLTTAYTKTGDAAIRKPFGGTPGFTSSMIFDFDRANEEAWRIGLSQNFAKLGLPGVSFIVNYTESRNSTTDIGELLPDADELDITVDFRPEKGFFKGLWLRVRYSDANRGSPVADREDWRITLNYGVSAL